jgi:hypothetical protein
MTTEKDPQTLHAAEAIRQLEALPARADTGRVEGLEALRRLRTAKAAMLAREQARLTARYGANHPRVQALTQQITVNRLLVNHVGAEAGRARVAQVDADPKAWILHGRVLNRDLKGQPGLTVALYDSRGAWVQALGFACTDSTGFFKLSATAAAAPGGSTAQPSSTGPTAQPGGGTLNQPPASGPATGPTSQPSKGGTANQPPTAPDAAAPRPTGGAGGPVYVHVLDSRSMTLWSDPRALNPTLGRVDYEEIILGDTKPQDCAPPDGKKPKAPESPSNQPSEGF